MKKYLTKKRKTKILKIKIILWTIIFTLPVLMIGFNYHSANAEFQSLINQPAIPNLIEIKEKTNVVKMIFPPKSPEDIIRQIAREENFSEVDMLLKLAYCESRYDPYAVGINWKHKSYDRGIFQLNSHFYKNISNDCSFNIACATKASIKIIRDRGFQEWSCWELIKLSTM